MTDRVLFKFIRATNLDSLSKFINQALADWYVLHWDIIPEEDWYCQAMVDKATTNLVIDEIKKNTNAWAVVVSGTITTKEW